MFYSNYFIQIADLHFWHHQLKAWQNHFVYCTRSWTGVKTVRRKTSWKQPWNWLPSAVPRMCRSEPSLPHDYHVTITWAAKRADLPGNRKNSRLAPRALSATREGRELETMQETLLGTKLKKELSMPDTNLRSTWQWLCATISKAITRSVAQQDLFLS